MVTFTIEIIGDTETRYNALSVENKQNLKNSFQVYTAQTVKSFLEAQEAEEDTTDDVAITVS